MDSSKGVCLDYFLTRDIMLRLPTDNHRVTVCHFARGTKENSVLYEI